MEVNVTASEIVVSSEGVSASVVIDLVFEKLVPSYEKFITVSFNASTVAEVFGGKCVGINKIVGIGYFRN